MSGGAADGGPEYVEFRGQRWFVALADFDEDGTGTTAGHWHLTLTAPEESRTPTRERPRRERATTSGIEWKNLEDVPGAILSASAQRDLNEKMRQIDEAQARAAVGARSYVIY